MIDFSQAYQFEWNNQIQHLVSPIVYNGERFFIRTLNFIKFNIRVGYETNPISVEEVERLLRKDSESYNSMKLPDSFIEDYVLHCSGGPIGRGDTMRPC